VFVHNSRTSIPEAFASVTTAEGERLTNVKVPLDGTPVEIKPQSDIFFNKEPQTTFNRWANSPVTAYVTGVGLGFAFGAACMLRR